MKVSLGHVLLVEYSPDMAAILQIILERERITVSVARTDTLGIELAIKTKFDLILVDWHFKGNSAAGKFHWLESDGSLPLVPVI
ncbi:MAG: hypothetical protein HY300_18980, partial [Verrucomicrobia bacterium]|nr:hypothetical protein [Verrucomicrobiota bacterium]